MAALKNKTNVSLRCREEKLNPEDQVYLPQVYILFIP
jgi:hypothetical protein